MTNGKPPPVVKMSVETKDGKDLPKLLEGLKRLAQEDQSVQVSTDSAGAHIIAGTSLTHLDVCRKKLGEHAGVALTFSKPFVIYFETVTAGSKGTALVKAPKSANRFYFTAEPLTAKVITAISNGSIDPADDQEARAKLLADEYNWETTEASRIWAFGPGAYGTSVLVDQTKTPTPHLDEVKKAIISGFQSACEEGPLTEEMMSGIRFNIKEAVLDDNMANRSNGKIIPLVRRVIYGSMLLAEPTLNEPIDMVDIKVPEDHLGYVYNFLKGRRSQVLGTDKPSDSQPGLFLVHAYVPVAESFDFMADLTRNSGGKASAHVKFDHWSVHPGALRDPHSLLNRVVTEIRLRKALKPEIPDYTQYCEKV